MELSSPGRSRAIIEDNDILTVCRYWANILRNDAVPFDELVNEAFVTCKKLENPKLLQKWVKWTMIHYIQRERFAIIQSKSLMPNTDGEGIEDFIEDKSFDFVKFNELKEELQSIIDKTCTMQEQKLLNAYIVNDKTFRQIAENDGVTFQAIYFRYRNAIKKLRREYDRRK